MKIIRITLHQNTFQTDLAQINKMADELEKKLEVAGYQPTDGEIEVHLMPSEAKIMITGEKRGAC